MNSRARVYLTLFAAILVLGCTRLLARDLEITQADLFSMKGWNSTQVSVYGLHLGITLEGATSALSERGLNLYDVDDRTACGPTSRFCSVSKEATQDGTDVTVQFGRGSGIRMIDIGSPLINPMGYHRNPADITANSFKGMTRRFFFHYSDDLRVKLLGPPDRVKKSPTTDAMQGQIYYYDRLGLIVSTSRALMRGMKEPTPPELRGIQLVLPKTLPQTRP